MTPPFSIGLGLGLPLGGGLAPWLPGTDLPILRAAVQATRAGTADTRILCIGDSTTKGIGSSTATTIPSAKAYPRILSQLINDKIAATQGVANGRLFGGTEPDDRWTYGTGWLFNGLSWNTAEGSSPAGTLTYTPDGGTTFDSFDVYYLRNFGLGTITVTATGGTPSVVSTNSASAGVGKVTVTAASAGSANSVSITGTGACYIAGVEPFLSTQRRVRVGNVGIPSSQTTSWDTATTGLGRMATVLTYAPHLTIVSSGLNDSGVLAATFQATLSSVVTKLKTVGDVVLWSPPPPQNDPAKSRVATYVAAYAAVAAAQSVPFVDIHTRWGGVYNSGFMTDALHPNDAGYADIADAIFAALS